MLTVNKLIPQGRGLAAALLRRAPVVDLDWGTRGKSRFDATDSAGRALGVSLARGQVVRGGDVLVADDGTLVRVVAAPQPVLVVRACAEHGSAFDLLRAAYHLGKRHVALELNPDHLKLEPDHALAELLRRMHLTVTDEHAAFEPESGAYGAGGQLGAHSHDAGDRVPAPGHAHPHPHAHGHDHGHGHDEHGHAHAHDHDHTPDHDRAR